MTNALTRNLFCLVTVALMAMGLSLTFRLHAQDLTVAAVRGNVKSAKTGKNLRPGDLIPETDKLTFRDRHDVVTLYTSDGQRKQAVFPYKRYSRGRSVQDLSVIIKDGPIATIPDQIQLNTIEEAKAFFGKAPVLFLGPVAGIQASKKVFPMSRALFFYVNYDFKEDNIDKKVDYRKDSVLIIKKNIFTIDGKEVDSKFAENFKIYYYNQPKVKHTFLARLRPHFPVDERLKEELDVMINLYKLKQATDEQIAVEAAGFMQQHYGSIIRANFVDWMKQHYPQYGQAIPAQQPRQAEALAPTSTTGGTIKGGR